MSLKKNIKYGVLYWKWSRLFKRNDETMENKHKKSLTNDGVATITIVDEFVDKAEGQENAQNVTANLTVTTTYV